MDRIHNERSDGILVQNLIAVFYYSSEKLAVICCVNLTLLAQL